MDPVDPGTALFGGDRTGRAEHHHRHAVAPGVKQTHHPVQEPDVTVQDAGHRLAGRLGITMRDRNRMVLMQADNDARILVPQMVDQTIVKPPIARPWVEADKWNSKPAQHLGGDIAAPSHLIVRLSYNLVQVHFLTFSLCRPAVARTGPHQHLDFPDGRKPPMSIFHRVICRKCVACHENEPPCGISHLTVTLKQLSHDAIFCLHQGKEGAWLSRFGGAGQWSSLCIGHKVREARRLTVISGCKWSCLPCDRRST